MTENNIKSSFFKNSLFLMLGSVSEKIFFFVINILIANYLTKEHFGEYSTALAFATFFSFFSNLGIGASTIRLINRNSEDRDQYFSISISSKFFLSAGAYLIMCIALSFTNYNEDTVYLVLILGLVRIGNEFILYLFSLFEVDSFFRFISFITFSFSFSFMAATIAVILLQGTYFDLVSVRLFMVLLFIVVLFLKAGYRYNFTLDYSHLSVVLKTFFKESLPFSISFLFNSTTTSLAALLLPLIHGTIYAGIYNNAYIFFVSLLFIPATLGRVIMPYLYRFDFKLNKDLYTSFYYIYGKIFSSLSFYFSIVFVIYAGSIIKLVFGDKYDESIPLLTIMGIAVPFAFNIALIIIPTINKQKINSIIDSIVWIVNIPLCIVLIKLYGEIGAALSITVLYVLWYLMTNIYLVYRGIDYSKIFIFRVKLLLTSSFLYMIDKFLLDEFHFIVAFCIVSFGYLGIVYGFFFTKKEKKNLLNIIGLSSK